MNKTQSEAEIDELLAIIRELVEDEYSGNASEEYNVCGYCQAWNEENSMTHISDCPIVRGRKALKSLA